MEQVVVAALYKFVELDDYVQICDPLLEFCQEHQIKGTLLLASEGINGTIAGSREGIDAVLAYLKSDARLSDLTHKESYATELPFYRMKVRAKKEIVTFGVDDLDPVNRVGEYVSPLDWNNLISQPDVVLIDTRNDYEVEIGTFKGATDPKTQTFREFPDYVKQQLDPEKQPKVAMFCTGGIRCEKATSYMLEQGFKEVYHLEGGILKYLEEVPEEESLWEGECFVFDHRVSVKHGLEEGSFELCYGCRLPVSREEKQSQAYEQGVCCSRCVDVLTEEQKRSARERQRQIELAKRRNQSHLGDDARISQ